MSEISSVAKIFNVVVVYSIYIFWKWRRCSLLRFAELAEQRKKLLRAQQPTVAKEVAEREKNTVISLAQTERRTLAKIIAQYRAIIAQ